MKKCISSILLAITFLIAGLDSSFQWAAFQRLTKVLIDRQNDLVVLIGPFNEHMLSEENKTRFRKLRDGIVEWFSENGISFILPDTLPSERYADASHPLTAGYARMAKELSSSERFRTWTGNIVAD